MQPLFVRVVSPLVLGLAFAGTTVTSLSGQEATPATGNILLPPDAEVAGLGLGEWAARQWQWFLSFPAELQPALDETGERCGLGQAGPVFFLVGGAASVERTCVVPLGTAVFVPAGGADCSTVEPPPFFGRDEAELRACAADATDSIDVSQIEVTIDGEPVDDLAAYRASTPLFSLVLPESNLFGAPAGVAGAVADGYQVMLDSLPEGEHVVTISDPNITVTYRLIVAPPQVVAPAATPAATPVATPLS